MAKQKQSSIRAKRITADIIVHIFLVIVAIVWLIPFVWLVAHSLRAESTAMFSATFFPKQYTFDNYIKLFTETSTMNFSVCS